MLAPARQRPLGAFETALTLTGEHAPFAVVATVRLQGAPPPDRLRAALRAAQRRLPLLRCRIARGDDGFRFEAMDEPPAIPLRVLERATDDEWQRVAEEELNRGFTTSSAPLLRCTYLAPQTAGEGGVASSPSAGRADAEGGRDRPRRGDLVLAAHHALLDATSAEALVASLLEHCAGVATASGAPEPTAPSPLPPPCEERYPPGRRGVMGAARRAAFLARQVADEATYRWRTRGTPAPAPPAVRSPCRVLPLRLGRDETAALVQRTRRRRVTLNAALNAALLLATVRLLHGARPGPYRYVTFADLRPRLHPSPGEDELGCFISMLRYTAHLPAGAAFWPLATALTRQVGSGARRGDAFAAAELGPMAMRQLVRRGDERLGTSAVSYSGVSRLRRRYGDIAVRALHASISNFPLGPESTMAARLFADELLLDLLYLDCDLDGELARRLGHGMLALLRCGDEAGGGRDRWR